MSALTAGRRAIAALALAGCSALPAHAADTLIEFYNTTLNHYFITIDPNEAAAIDSGAAGPGWQRTGKTIAAYISPAAAPAGAAAVCRFYGNVAAGGPNGHFYTADAAECAQVKQDAGWHYERIEFYVQTKVGGACPANTAPVYRAYNGRFAQHDSNHRYTTDVATYNGMVAQGWSGEGVVFCAASAATTPPADNSDCATLYVPGQTLDYETSTNAAGSTNASSFTRTFGPDTTFNGQQAKQVIDTPPTGTPTIQFIQDFATEWVSLGNRTTSNGVTTDLINSPPSRTAKQWTVGQTRSYAFQVLGAQVGTGQVNGTMQLLRRESVTVPGGTFDACVFHFDQTTTYPIGSNSHSVSDAWVAPNVGMVKQNVHDTTIVSGFNIDSTATITLKKQH